MFRRFFQFFVMFGVILVSTLVTSLLVLSVPDSGDRRSFRNVYSIETIIASRSDNRPEFVVYGETVSSRSVDLRSLVSGEIVSVSDELSIGSYIDAGDVLVEIDSFTYEGALSEARSNLSEARAKVIENEARLVLERDKHESAIEQLGLAEADLSRVMTLRERGTSTQQQVDSRELVVSQRRQALSQSSSMIRVEESRLAQMDATIDRLEWRVRRAERDLENTRLVAPFSGIVRASSAEVGRLVNVNDILVSLYDGDSLEVRFTLSDSQYGRLSSDLVGRPLSVTWNIGDIVHSWTGVIDRPGAEINSSRGGVEVFGTLDESANDVFLRPGAFVEVTVPDKTFVDTISVPDASVYDGNRVYVVESEQLVSRDVEIVAYDGETALVSSGLQDGDEVLVTRITEVSDGLNVRVVRRRGE